MCFYNIDNEAKQCHSACAWSIHTYECKCRTLGTQLHWRPGLLEAHLSLLSLMWYRELVCRCTHAIFASPFCRSFPPHLFSYFPPNPLQMMAGRCTKAFYEIMGIEDCIAKSKTDFVDIAVRLGIAIDYGEWATMWLSTNTCHSKPQGYHIIIPVILPIVALDPSLRHNISERIKAASHKLWERRATIGEWEAFFTQLVLRQPVTFLHTKSPWV